jgi:methylglutaconyl-CoA hydratase
MTKTYKTIKLAVDERGLATLTLNRPDKHHAFNAEMIGELHDAADGIAADHDIRVLLITSSGPSFCAGGDLGWMKEQHHADRAGKIAEATKLAMMLKAFHDLPQPVICRVQGQAFGGGLGLMAISDIVIAAEDAHFALTETRLGLIPATIGPFVIAKIGGTAARSVFITGSRISSERARDLELVSIRAEPENLDDAVDREVRTALKASPEAMRRAKNMLRQITAPDLDAQITLAINHLADCWESEEAAQGISAFFNKEKAPWIKD